MSEVRLFFRSGFAEQDAAHGFFGRGELFSQLAAEV
jgi:hypothetical protein